MYSIVIPISLGSSRTGLVLAAQLYDPSDGSPVGSPVFSGFVERVGGRYDWSGSLPDNQTIGVAFLSGADELASTIINPSDAYDIIRTLARVVQMGQGLITITSPVSAGGAVRITRGDDYKVGSINGPLVWHDSTGKYAALVGDTGSLVATLPGTDLTPSQTFDVDVACTYDTDGTTVLFTAELLSIDTEDLPLSPDRNPQRFAFVIRFTPDSGVVTPIISTLTLVADVVPAP